MEENYGDILAGEYYYGEDVGITSVAAVTSETVLALLFMPEHGTQAFLNFEPGHFRETFPTRLLIRATFEEAVPAARKN
jgi:hypothetical protein